MNTGIYLPAVALVLLTAIVWFRLYLERVGEIRERRIDPQSLATAAGAGQVLKRVQASDNLKNLFEIPVLFYVLCFLLAESGMASSLFTAGAWLYVILRGIHSYIHLTYNRVMHRFTVYFASTLLLFLMWGVFAFELLRASPAS